MIKIVSKYSLTVCVTWRVTNDADSDARLMIKSNRSGNGSCYPLRVHAMVGHYILIAPTVRLFHSDRSLSNFLSFSSKIIRVSFLDASNSSKLIAPDVNAFTIRDPFSI